MSEQEHAEIWLQPWCDGCAQHSYYNVDDGRQWCQDAVFDPCEECGREPVRYVIAAPPLSPEKTGGEQ